MPLPEPLIRPVFTRLFRMGALDVPPGALDYLKYPITLDGGRFAHATGFRPLFGLPQTLVILFPPEARIHLHTAPRLVPPTPERKKPGHRPRNSGSDPDRGNS